MFQVYMQCLNMDINLAQKKGIWVYAQKLIIESNLKEILKEIFLQKNIELVFFE